jgi:hypothetical protein
MTLELNNFAKENKLNDVAINVVRLINVAK